MKVVVIGAGIVGASVAYRLARAGASVTILEARWVGSGTSSASLAWINANNKPPRSYHELNAAGLRAHEALREEFPGMSWWHRDGNVEWAVDVAARTALGRRIARLREWGYAAEEITARRLGELEPDIDPGPLRGASIAYFPEEGWLDPVVYAHAMVEAAIGAGARLLVHEPVREIRRTGERVVGVTTGGGQRHDADCVVNCAGRWANDVAGEVGLGIPLAPTMGLLAITPPVPVRLRVVVHAPCCQVRPDGGGRLMVQADDTDEMMTPETLPSAALEPAADIVRRAARLLPGIEGVGPEAVRIGTRAYPADGFSAVGPLPGVTGYYLAVTHSGVTMAPALGTIIADEIVLDREDARLATFRPGRFSAERS
ncbi:MAG TPA: FAD-binding oxidoreductase [bacterium]|nr:FAD-binding oxidoreductase [bacterium]